MALGHGRRTHKAAKPERTSAEETAVEDRRRSQSGAAPHDVVRGLIGIEWKVSRLQPVGRDPRTGTRRMRRPPERGNVPPQGV